MFGKRADAVLSAAFSLDAVAVRVVPIAKLPAGGGVALEALTTDPGVPSGSLKVKLTLSPSLGVGGAKSIEPRPANRWGPVTVAPFNDTTPKLSFEAERRAGGVLGDRTDVGVGARSRDVPKPVFPLGLRALVHHPPPASIRPGWWGPLGSGSIGPSMVY